MQPPHGLPAFKNQNIAHFEANRLFFQIVNFIIKYTTKFSGTLISKQSFQSKVITCVKAFSEEPGIKARGTSNKGNERSSVCVFSHDFIFQCIHILLMLFF
jgi:hypothetical protein